MNPFPPLPSAFKAQVPRTHFQPTTKGFLRQGSWLFEPALEIDVPLVIHWCAPLARPGGGTPHVVAELGRGLGEMLWHHATHALDGLTDRQFRALPDDTRLAPGWTERLRVTEADALVARGSVRHPEHDALFLPHWHRVYLI